MTSFHGDLDRSNLDAYLDDALADPDRARMAREISASRELQAEVELQKRIDESLRRSFAPTAVPERLLAKLREEAPAAQFVPPLRRRRMMLAAAAAAAVLVWSVLGWQYVANSSKTPRYNPNLPLATIYEMQVAAGFKPKWVCDDDREFASTFLTRQGQGLLLAAMPEGSKMVGLTYCGGISRYTTSMLARVGNVPVMVFVDRLSADTHPHPPADDTKLHLFRKELGSLVLYELTPLEQPGVMDYLYPAEVPVSK
jgi:hypothetical protein